MTTDDDAAEDRMLDHLLAGEPAASPEEQAARAPYEAIIADVRELPITTAPPGFHERVRAGWRAARVARRRRRMVLVAGAVLALAAAVILFLLRPHRGAGSRRNDVHVDLAILTKDGSTWRAAGSHARIGDTLQIRGRAGAGATEVRVYFMARLVARCPTDERCRGLALDLPLAQGGKYVMAWLSSATAVPPPDERGLDADSLRVRSQGGVFEIAHEIDVTR